MNIPLKEGTTATVEEICTEPITAKKFNSKATLTDLSQDYILFSHASIVLFTPLSFDPIQVYAQRFHTTPTVLMVDQDIFHDHASIKGAKFQAPLPKMFNRLIYALPKHEWPIFLKLIGTIGIRHKESKTYINIVPQKLPLLDVIDMSKRSVIPDVLPTVEIYLFALDGNKRCIHYKPSLNLLVQPIQVLDEAPNENIVTLAKLVFEDTPTFVFDKG